jgi:hypothetical protein
MTILSISKPTHRYICAAGHTMEMVDEWTALQVDARKYVFCFDCYGEWAQKQWPMKREELKP